MVSWIGFPNSDPKVLVASCYGGCTKWLPWYKRTGWHWTKWSPWYKHAGWHCRKWSPWYKCTGWHCTKWSPWYNHPSWLGVKHQVTYCTKRVPSQLTGRETPSYLLHKTSSILVDWAWNTKLLTAQNEFHCTCRFQSVDGKQVCQHHSTSVVWTGKDLFGALEWKKVFWRILRVGWYWFVSLFII